MADDSELLQIYNRDGSDHAFAEIVRKYSKLVYATASRYVQPPAAAEEVVQSVFIDLAKSAHKLKANTVLPAWLCQVARRTALDACRKEFRRLRCEQEASQLSVDAGTPWASVEPQLENAVASLPETERAVVRMRYFEKKSLRTIGSLLGISEVAAQKRGSRALARLREFFSGNGCETFGTRMGQIMLLSTMYRFSADLFSSIPILYRKLVGGILMNKTVSAAAAAMVISTGVVLLTWKSQLDLERSNAELREQLGTFPAPAIFAQKSSPAANSSVQPAANLAEQTSGSARYADEDASANSEPDVVSEDSILQPKTPESMTADMTASLARKLLPGARPTFRGTFAEASFQMGRSLDHILDFGERWCDSRLTPGSPEEAKYLGELDAMTTEIAEWLTHPAFESPNPDEAAYAAAGGDAKTFLSYSMKGALDLEEGQRLQIDSTIKRCVDQRRSEKLAAATPGADQKILEQQRAAQQQQIYTELQSPLSPEQRERFLEIYPKDALFKGELGVVMKRKKK